MFKYQSFLNLSKKDIIHLNLILILYTTFPTIRPIAVPSCLLRPITIRLSEDMSEVVEQLGILGVSCATLMPQYLSESIDPQGDLQFGFRAGHSTQDAIYLLSTLIHKCKRRGKKYHAMFIDLAKVTKHILFSRQC